MKRRRKNPGLVERIARDRKAPAGMYRLLIVDTFSPPGDHFIEGDYGTIGSARGEGLRLIASDPWLEAIVYDDQGRVSAPPARWLPPTD